LQPARGLLTLEPHCILGGEVRRVHGAARMKTTDSEKAQGAGSRGGDPARGQMGLSRYSSGIKGLAYAILIVALINLCQAGICYLILISLPVSYIEYNKSISDWCIIVSWILCLIPFILYLKNRDKSYSIYTAEQNGNSLKY